MTVVGHLWKAIVAVAVLLVIVALYHRTLEVDAADEAHDSRMTGDAGATPLSPIREPDVLAEDTLATAPTDETWKRTIAGILRDDAGVADKSLRMLDLFPRLPVSMQAEAAQHLVNFATDERPQAILRALMEQTGDCTAQGVLLLGLLQRADRVRLPALLQIARDTQHLKTVEARKYLAFVLEQDHGTNWAAWEQAIGERVKDNTR